MEIFSCFRNLRAADKKSSKKAANISKKTTKVEKKASSAKNSKAAVENPHAFTVGNCSATPGRVNAWNAFVELMLNVPKIEKFEMILFASSVFK